MDIQEEHRNSLLTEAFRADIEISRIQDHIRSLLQMAVDMDIQRLGYVDKLTMNSVDSFNLAIDNSSHRIYPKEYFAEDEEPYRPPNGEQEADKNQKEIEAEAKYITYTDVDGKETVMEGDDLGELMAKWRKLEDGRDADNRIGHVFVIRNDPELRYGYETYKYEITTGKDITPVYLSLPPMGKEELARTEQYLKDNGAKFNSRKAWYVTRDMDLSKFSQYIYQASKQETLKQKALDQEALKQEVPKQEALKQEDAGEKKHSPEPRNRETAGGKTYYSYAYTKNKSIMRYSDSSVEAVTAHWKKTETGRDVDDKIGYFYMKEKNVETGKYSDASRYEIATGKDVTPVYLSLPPMGKNDFIKTVQYLRDNGAKFNSTKKKWYVTRDMDLSKFQQFLPQELDTRASVIGKLEGSRKAAAGQQNHVASEKKYEAAR